MMNFLARPQRTILSAAAIIGVSSVASRVLGLLRDRVLAGNFGAGPVLDAYYAAFRIPDFIFNILIAGTLATAFIPVFTLLITQKRTEDAWRVTSAIITSFTVVLVVVSAAIFIAAPMLLPYTAPGFSAETQHLAVLLTRIMLLSPLLFGISSVIGGVLNSLQRFIAYALAPVVYNVGIIIGVLVFVPWWGPVGLAFGVVLGAVLYLLIQLPSLTGTHFRFRPQLGWNIPEVRRIGKLSLPRVVGAAATQINLLVATGVASTLTVGSVAIFNLANNLQSFPLGVFGISFSVAAFPALAAAASRGDSRGFVTSFGKTFRQVLYLIVPASMFIILLRAQIVRLVLGTGNFGWDDTARTAATLGFFAVSLFAQSTLPLLTKAFYALQDTRTPVLVGTGSVVVNIILTILLTRQFGVIGLALAFSISAGLNVVVLLGLLRVRIGDLDDAAAIRSAVRTTSVALIAGLALYGSLYFFDIFVDTHRYVGLLLQTMGALAVGVLVYLGGSLFFKNEEVPLRMLLRRFWRRTSAALPPTDPVVVPPTDPADTPPSITP